MDRESAPILALNGNLDRTGCSFLDEWLDQTTSPGERVVNVDLSGVRRFDARGLAALVSAFERFRSSRRVLRVVSASDKVRSTLERQGLDFMLKAY